MPCTSLQSPAGVLSSARPRIQLNPRSQELLLLARRRRRRPGRAARSARPRWKAARTRARWKGPTARPTRQPARRGWSSWREAWISPACPSAAGCAASSGGRRRWWSCRCRTRPTKRCITLNALSLVLASAVSLCRAGAPPRIALLLVSAFLPSSRAGALPRTVPLVSALLSAAQERRHDRYEAAR
jgi:hypothetical protein